MWFQIVLLIILALCIGAPTVPVSDLDIDPWQSHGPGDGLIPLMSSTPPHSRNSRSSSIASSFEFNNKQGDRSSEQSSAIFTSLMKAVQSGHHSDFDDILRDADIEIIDAETKFGMTALNFAADKQDKYFMYALMEKCASPKNFFQGQEDLAPDLLQYIQHFPNLVEANKHMARKLELSADPCPHLELEDVETAAPFPVTDFDI